MIVKIYENKKSKEPFFELDPSIGQSLGDMLGKNEGIFRDREKLIEFVQATTAVFMIQFKMLVGMGIANKQSKKLLFKTIDATFKEGQQVEEVVGGLRGNANKSLKRLKEMRRELELKVAQETDKARIKAGNKILKDMDLALKQIEEKMI